MLYVISRPDIVIIVPLIGTHYYYYYLIYVLKNSMLVIETLQRSEIISSTLLKTLIEGTKFCIPSLMSKNEPCVHNTRFTAIIFHKIKYIYKY